MRLTANDAGCYVGGSWGHYGVARMIQRAAEEWGYDNKEVVDLAHKKLRAMMPSFGPELTLGEEDLLSESASSVEEWLNDNVAPDGYCFGWCDGEFFLWSELEWDAAE